MTMLTADPVDLSAVMPVPPGDLLLAAAPICPVVDGAAPAAAPADLPLSRYVLAEAPALTRAAQVSAAMAASAADPRFTTAVAEADAARDSGDWALALERYGAALALHPLQWGYCIQYAHMAKELGDLLRAEAWYRTAAALGAPADMVGPHLAYVARRNGIGYVAQTPPDLAVAPLLAPPTVPDIRLLGALLRVPGLGDDAHVLDLLRRHRDNRAVLCAMLAMPEFARNNRDLLAMVQAAHHG